MKKYDNYKDSGIEWISEIPEHWKMQRLKYAFDLGTGLSITKENLVDVGVPCVSYGEIHSKYGFEVDINKHNLKCVDVDYLNTSIKALMKQGEFIFADTSEDIEGSGNFTHVKSDGDIFAGYHTITVRPINKKNSLYFAFLFDSIDFRTQIRSSVKGIKVFSITQGILKDTFIWHPPLEEQIAIASYLDRKTTQIDTLISKKEQFITLLQEERTAVINHTVTKGLDPKVKMKDSGIEWLGEIPEHWGLNRIGHISKVIRGASPRPAGDPLLFNGDFLPWITVKEVTNAKGKYITSTDTFLTELGAIQTRILEPETLILSNSGATLGVPRITLIKGGINDGSVAFLNLKVERDYLYYFFTTHTNIYRDEASGYGQPNLNTEIVKSTKIPVPTIQEQQEIIKFIEKELSIFQTLISKSEQEIELLKEYKMALISEVVTGKVDVRNEILN
jgi:type I restriction enzyme S subunit